MQSRINFETDKLLAPRRLGRGGSDGTDLAGSDENAAAIRVSPRPVPMSPALSPAERTFAPPVLSPSPRPGAEYGSHFVFFFVFFLLLLLLLLSLLSLLLFLSPINFARSRSCSAFSLIAVSIIVHAQSSKL